jgi:dephospho-CoA kinase
MIGLTGGVAAGKSEALRIFAELGAETLSADTVVHELLGTDEVRQALVDRWGEGIAPEGDLERGAVGSIVFSDSDELAWLESYLHPLVGERITAWAKRIPEDREVAVVEVPLLFEGDLGPMFDATIAVVAEDAVRLERARERGTTQLEGRDGRQLSQDRKAELATHVAVNEGSVHDLREQLAAIHDGLLSTRR